MVVVSHRLRPAVRASLDKAIAAAERHQEIAFQHVPVTSYEALSDIFGSAAVVALDLTHCPVLPLLALLADLLSQHPLVKVILVPVPLSKIEEQQALFDLGRAGVTHLPLPHEVIQATWWLEVFASLQDFSSLHRAHAQLRSHVPDGPRGDFILRVAEHAIAPSIKQLATKLYPHERHSVAYKRRLLWRDCKALGFMSPEAVHAGVRFLLLKSLVDHGHWSNARLARYFGFATVRHLSRSCRTRYGRPLTALRHVSYEHVRDDVQARYWNETRQLDPV